MTRPTTLASPASLPATNQLAIFQPEIFLPSTIILGYLAFVVTGFATGLGHNQPLPLYIYLSLLLFLLQVYLSKDRSALRTGYALFAAIFSIVYAAQVTFQSLPFNFTRNAVTYVILNVLVFVVFIVDAIQSQGGASMPGAHPITPNDTPTIRVFRSLSTTFAGLGIVGVLSSILLDSLHNRVFLSFFGILRDAPAYTNTSLNDLFNISLPGSLSTLEGVNLTIGYIGLAIWLLLLAVIGGLAGGQLANQGGESSVNTLLGAFRVAVTQGFLEAFFSLRSVLEIYIWLIPAFSVANFAQQVVNYFNSSAMASSKIIDLFNPLSQNSINSFGQGLFTIALGILALAAVIVAVAITEFDVTIIRDTANQLGGFLRTISLSLVFITLSLAFTNAVAILTGITRATPFQVGTSTVAGIIAFAIFATYSFIRSRMDAPTPA